MFKVPFSFEKYWTVHSACTLNLNTIVAVLFVPLRLIYTYELHTRIYHIIQFYIRFTRFVRAGDPVTGTRVQTINCTIVIVMPETSRYGSPQR